MQEKLDNLLEQERPRLSSEERALLLRAIEKKVTTPLPSPYLPFIYSRTMTALVLVLVLALGASGTVLASENAKSGDLLFPIERASEQARLALARGDREAELQAQFANERFSELREIISEEKNSSFADDRTTTDNSFFTINEASESRITLAVQVLLNYLEGVEDTDSRTALLKELLSEINVIKVAGRSGKNGNGDSKDSRLKLSDDRIEVREDGYRVRIDRNENIRIRSDDDSDEDVLHDSDNSFHDSMSDDDYGDDEPGDDNKDRDSSSSDGEDEDYFEAEDRNDDHGDKDKDEDGEGDDREDDD